jgi:hypothetical protein
MISSVISSTCLPKYTFTNWARVNFVSGPDGWVEQKNLLPAGSLSLSFDSTLQNAKSTTVYASPGGSSKGTQPNKAIGVVNGSPVTSGGKVWWPVNYRTGADGWVDQANIKNEGTILTSPAPKIISVTENIIANNTYASYVAKDLDMTPEELRQAAANLGGYDMRQPSLYTNTDGKTYTFIKVRDHWLNEHVVGYHVDPVTDDMNVMALARNKQGVPLAVSTRVEESDDGDLRLVYGIDTNMDNTIDDVIVGAVHEIGDGWMLASLVRQLPDGSVEVLRVSDPFNITQDELMEYFKRSMPPLDPATVIPFDDDATITYGELVTQDEDEVITIKDGFGYVGSESGSYELYSSPEFWFQGDTRAYARYANTMELMDYYMSVFMTDKGKKVYK